MKLAGYRNIAKGLRHLDKFLASGDAPDFFIIRLRDAVGLAPEECDVAIAEHRKVLREKEEREQEAYLRSVFKPHLIVGTDGSSQAPVFMKIFLSHRRTIYLPEDKLHEEKVAEIVRDHFAKHKGYMEAFGKITCYIFRPIYDESIIFGIDGSVLERVNRPLWGPTGFSVAEKWPNDSDQHFQERTRERLKIISISCNGWNPPALFLVPR
ncbi:MAG: hypothetical protein OZSIB_2361 [Candidatus Ozemobacter sibiricus]|uniref:Uncharacterized protein n=1 Tax=Candidatus Ozemobacter sibiricus TaxID=2268124 RepID=A0A367ZS61_9BACT|nr:MAG: hypothetical protein OZSIB_2361 [Candidatus Ozemobacter sibiricus]